MKQIQNNTKKMTANYSKKHSDSAKKLQQKREEKYTKAGRKLKRPDAIRKLL